MIKVSESFSHRLTKRILMAVMVTMIIVSGLLFMASLAAMSEETNGRYFGILHIANEKVEKILKENEDAVINVADEVQYSLQSPATVMEALASELQLNPNTQGYFAAFEPNYFTSKGYFFEPYAYWKANHQLDTLDVGSAKHNYMARQWYQDALNSENGIWSDPYFDEVNNGQVLCSFVSPLRDRQGKLIGVVGSDVSLSWLMERLENIETRSNKRGLLNIKENDSSLGFHIFVISKNGTYIAHPDRKRILKGNMIEYAKLTPDTLDDYLVKEMLSQKQGSLSMKLDGVRSHIIYRPIENTQWSMALVIPELAFFGPGILLGVTTLLLILISMQTTYYFCRRTINKNTEPLKALADSANEVAKGNFVSALPDIKYNDEIRELRDSFASMQLSLVQYIQELETTTAKKAAFDRELNIAHSIQMAMVPAVFPPFPERHDIDIFGSLKTAKSIGGDLFDFFIRKEKLFFCIGDVSGKSIPAALVMTVIHALFRTVVIHEEEPSRMVSMINQPFAEDNDQMMFCTFFLGVLDLKTGKLSYTNAGHEPPLLINDKVTLLDVTRNLPLGIMADQAYNTQHIMMDKDTTLFIYTDGLTDATNIDNQRFSRERLIKTAEIMKQTDSETLVNGIIQTIDAYVGKAEQADDLTMLAIKMK